MVKTQTGGIIAIGGLSLLTNGLPFVRLIGDLHVRIVLSHLRNQLCRSEADCLDIVSPGGATTKQDLSVKCSPDLAS